MLTPSNSDPRGGRALAAQTLPLQADADLFRAVDNGAGGEKASDTGGDTTVGDEGGDHPPRSEDGLTVREVVIHCNRERCYSLCVSGGRCAVIADGHTAIVALLALKVLGDFPSDPVVWRYLNEAVGSDDTAAASNTLRQTLARLNASVRKELRLPREVDDLFETVRGKGVRLSPSVRWSVSKGLAKLLRAGRSPRVIRDPGALAAILPGRGQRLPSRSVRGRRGGKSDA